MSDGMVRKWVRNFKMIVQMCMARLYVDNDVKMTVLQQLSSLLADFHKLIVEYDNWLSIDGNYVEY